MGLAFDAARRNPRSLVGEPLVSQGLLAMRASRDIVRQSLEAGNWPGIKTRHDDGDNFRLWVNYIGSDSRQAGSVDRMGYSSRFNGLVSGASAGLGEFFYAGAYCAYARAKTSYQSALASVDTDIVQTGVFAGLSPLPDLHLLADMSYVRANNKSRRDTPMGRNLGHFRQNVFSAGLKARYDFYSEREFVLTPSVGLLYQHFRQAGFTESGAALTHRMNPMSASSLTGSLGLGFSRDFPLGESDSFTPAIYVSLNREFADTELQTGAEYAGYGSYFDISSGKWDRNSAELGINLRAKLTQANKVELSFIGGYNVQFSNSYRNQQFYAGIDLRF